MKKIYFLFVLPLIFMSCSDELTSTINPKEFKISASSDTITVFPWSLNEFEITVVSGEFSGNATPLYTDTLIGSVEISGPWFRYNDHKKLYYQISAKGTPASAVTMLMTIQIGNQIAQVPITVRVSEFYPVVKFITNLPNDTISIPRGGNCLLKITCIDSSGNITPKRRIERLGYGLNYGINRDYHNWKFTVTTAERDSISYYIMFSAFPDIVPGTEDSSLWFTLYLSNRTFALPIVIKY